MPTGAKLSWLKPAFTVLSTVHTEKRIHHCTVHQQVSFYNFESWWLAPEFEKLGADADIEMRGSETNCLNTLLNLTSLLLKLLNL